jgi:Protein of unknown function (DUF3237)
VPYFRAQLRYKQSGFRFAMLSPTPIFRVHAVLADTLNVGRTPNGERRMVAILGGRVEGDQLNGHILPGGADWQIIRSDGAADIKARYVVETASGGRVLITSEGLRHGPPDVLARLAAGEPVARKLYYFRTVMRFETADPTLDRLNRILALASGERQAKAVNLDVYEVL